MTVSYYYTFATDDALRAPNSNVLGSLDVVFRAKMPAWNTGGTSMALVSNGFFAWEVISYLGNFYLAINGANQGSCSIANLGITNNVTYWFRVARNHTTGAIDWYVQPNSDDVPVSWGTAKTDGGTQAAGAINATSKDLCIGARPNSGDSGVSVFLTGDVYDVIVKDDGITKFAWRGRTDFAESGSFPATTGGTITISGATLQSYIIPGDNVEIVNVTINSTVVEVVNVTINPVGIQTVTVSVDDVGTNTADISALQSDVGAIDTDVTTLLSLIKNEKLSSWNATGNKSTTGWADVPGTPTITFTKLVATSSVFVQMFVSYYAQTVGGCYWGVSINGTDYGLLTTFQNEASIHQGFGGVFEITGLTAGSKSIKLRWQPITNGQQQNIDTNDIQSFHVREVLRP